MIAIVGTGAWGVAIAASLAHSQQQIPESQRQDIVLWGRDAGKVADLAASRSHPALAGVRLPASIRCTSAPSDLAGAGLVFWAVPTQFTRRVAGLLAAVLPADAGIVSLSKGLEQGTLLRVSEVLTAALGTRPLAALSGPSHAEEVVQGLPACLVAAGDAALCQRVVERLHGRRLRIYTSGDLLGVELGGALKNVIAVAAGLGDGLGLGDNAKAALITRGLTEIRRLGRALGAQDRTFAGMAGIGDLMTTCYSPHGRNRALGLAVGRGARPADALASLGGVAEGAWTCRAAVALGTRAGVELPIAYQVASVLWADMPVASALSDLLARAPKEEDQ